MHLNELQLASTLVTGHRCWLIISVESLVMRRGGCNELRRAGPDKCAIAGEKCRVEVRHVAE